MGSWVTLLVGGCVLVAAGTALCITGHGADGLALLWAGAAELGAKGGVTLLAGRQGIPGGA